VKVMDFGIARAIADTAATMTNTSVVIGTAQYLSPEQAQGSDVDARSDVYGAGCVLYELLSGRTPFVGDSPVAIAYQHVGEEPRPASAHATGVPFDIDCVVLHALAKRPQDRYQDAQAMADDLYAVHHGMPIGAAARATGLARKAGGRGTDAAATPRGEAATEPGPAVPIAATDPLTGVLPTYVPPPRNRRAVLALITAILLAAGAVFWAVSSGFVGVRHDVAVPEVTGHLQSAAMAELSSAGFSPIPDTVKDLRPPGTVVSQDPPAGSLRQPNSPVTLFVSGGPGVVTVPDVKHFAPSSAEQVLRNQGLHVGRIRMQDSADVAKGLVIATEPKADQKVDGSVRVDLLVSTGQVTVPDVLGKTYEDAQQILSKVNLVARPRFVASTKRVGTVVRQTHRKERVPSSTEIDLDVVDSPPATIVKTITPSPAPTRTPDVPVPADTSTPDPTSR
jgi:eukaryotic-like serine/threonine-protein kinase